MNTSAWRFLPAVLVMASVGVLFSDSADAGKKKPVSQVGGDSFQLTLSNKVYNGDPQDKFLRQSCEPGQHARVSAKISKSVSAKASSRKTKMSPKRPATK